MSQLIRISLEGPSVADFDALAAIDLWAMKTIRRPNQRERKRYKSRNTAGNKAKVLIDESSSSDDSEDKDEIDAATLSELIDML